MLIEMKKFNMITLESLVMTIIIINTITKHIANYQIFSGMTVHNNNIFYVRSPLHMDR